MNSLSTLIVALCVYALAYRYYSAFLAARVLVLNDARITPAHTCKDGQNYLPTPKWVLFGHHFAAIAGAGPLVGPTLAAQFGFAPGLVWLVLGAVLAGAVQDFTVLVASTRHKGRSLAEIARTEISPFAGLVAMIAVLFILLVTLAGLGIVVVNALAASPWGVFTIGMTIPIALGMGVYMFKGPGGKIRVIAQRRGRNAADGIFDWRTLCSHLGMGRDAYFQPAPDHAAAGGLWFHCIHLAGVAAACAARLSFDLREAGNHCGSDCGRVRGPSARFSFPPPPASFMAAVRSSRGTSFPFCL